MNKMSKESLELFYRLDEKKYLVSENEELKIWLEKLECPYQEEDIQNFIDKLSSWYFVKYPDKYLTNDITVSSSETISFTSGMNFKTLFHSFDTVDLELIQFQGDSKTDHIKELFCQYLFQLIGYEMIYFKNTTPRCGFFRAKLLFRDFNCYFGWKLDTKIYDDIMKKNYSMNNLENLQLLNFLREKQDPNSRKGKKELRRFLHRCRFFD